MLNHKRLILVFLWLFSHLSEAQLLLKGTVVEIDSMTPMPFVYIINKSNGNGTMSDNDGKFVLASSPYDTLVCSYVGYVKLYIPVSRLKPNAKGELKLVMNYMPINLGTVNITAFKFKAYERQYMKDIIERSRIKKLAYATSPVNAMYMRYSKEGKQVQKLAKIFEQILIEEEVQKKFNKDILVKLTGDETVDYDAFRKYCYKLNDNFIITHEGAELYLQVMDCYKRYKADNGGYNLREEVDEDGNKKKPVLENDGYKKREEKDDDE